MGLRNVTLEISGKAFTDDLESTMERVCTKMFRQWANLTESAQTISIMLWIADGSEILEYSGDLDQKFEWACYTGCANHLPQPKTYTEREKLNTHCFPVKYRKDAQSRTYSWLKRLIEIIRRCGQDMTGKPIRVGATFDNGPEFALSDFKFNRHKEIANGHSMYPNSFVTCNSLLNADERKYAAFPEGIKLDTSLGEFLGKQFNQFSQDLGYDYIWLSNGMGFGIETWGITGSLFDKTEFHPEKCEQATETMLQFWRDFYAASGEVCVETRGSNFSAGVEISTDAAPLLQLYREYKIAPPVNSPWAALNYNSGLEIAAWMSHVAELPDDRFPYRFYAHDPWFMNSPWLDRYGRQPWDIYQPLSICRIKEDGEVQTPDSVAILTIDDTMGRMPQDVPNEVIPHLLAALDHAPDNPGPLVWVYPFEQYASSTQGGSTALSTVFNEDMFLGECIQSGAPINTVISTNALNEAIKAKPQLVKNSIFVLPVSAYFECAEELNTARNIIFYGSLANASEELLGLTGLTVEKPLSGKVHIKEYRDPDSFENGAVSNVSYVLEQFDDGGICEIVRDRVNVTKIATVEQENQERVISSVCVKADGVRIGFVRSILPCDPQVDCKNHLFDRLGPESAFPVSKLMRDLLAHYGWQLFFDAYDASSLLPRTNISCNDNSLYYSLFAPDTTVAIKTSTPYGAPAFNETDCIIEHGVSHWHSDKSMHKQARCFVQQNNRSKISCKIGTAEYPCYSGRLNYYGFDNATVRFYPPKDCGDKFEAVQSDRIINHHQILHETPMTLEWEDTAIGKCVVIRNVTGNLYFTW